MEYSAFRDYCKAENSEDETINHDLQSRLYAEIYYTSNDTVNPNMKTNVKLEDFDDKSKLLQDACNKMSGSNNSPARSTVNDTNKGNHHVNDSSKSSLFIEQDVKPDIKTILVGDKAEAAYKGINNKDNTAVPITSVNKYSENTDKVVKNHQDISTCIDTKCVKSKPDINSIQQNIKEVRTECKEELKNEQHSNDEVFVTPSPQLSTIKHNVDNNTDKHDKAKSTAVNVDSSYDNILKKYEFSKLFINKLYLEKYENINKRLSEIEGEKVRNISNQECLRKDSEASEEIEEELNNCRKPASDADVSKYSVLSKTEKALKEVQHVPEIVESSSETESESESSILEVPIPPKPQPPVINLQDSESSDIMNYDSDDDCFCISDEEVTSLANSKKNTSAVDLEITTLDSSKQTQLTEDIVLNCTNMQKGASSTKEIIKMSRAANLDKCSTDSEVCRKNLDTDNVTDNLSVTNNKVSKSSLVYERDKDVSMNVGKDTVILNSPNLSKTTLNEKRCQNKQNNMPKVHSIRVVNERKWGSSACKRSRTEMINFAEDVAVTNFLDNIEPGGKKKRYEDENEIATTMRSGNVSERKRPKITSTKNIDRSNQDQCQQFTFGFVPKNVDAFFNDTRGQQNLDLHEIQSRMSKDPRHWAILDEDLMPNLLKRQRYWHMKCNNCQQNGHQTHNCPEPFKPVRCHMCGSIGHLESRCPEKMCLTCGKKQGTFRKTCESCRVLYCTMCKAIGHKATECPDLWRRFHQTTQMSNINIPENLSEVMKPADLLYCCNCTKRGHDSSTCHEYRWSQHFPTPAFVSNYTDGPGSDTTRYKNTTEDMIPLITEHKARSTIHDNDNELNDCDVLYSYGSLNGEVCNEQIKRKLAGEQVFSIHVRNFLAGQVTPLFLDELIKIVPFNIVIYRNANKELMIRVQSTMDVCTYLLEIFVFWLKLTDEDKHLRFYIQIPRKTSKLTKFLNKALTLLERTLDDPRYLHSKIEEIKLSMTRITDSAVAKVARVQILNFRKMLLKHFIITQNKNVSLVQRIKKIIKEASHHKEVGVNIYINAIIAYNKMIVPRALTDFELNRLFEKHDKQMKHRKEPKIKKDKQKKGNANRYEKFVKMLQKYNDVQATSKQDNKKDITSTVTKSVTASTSDTSYVRTVTNNATLDASSNTENVANKTSLTVTLNLMPTSVEKSINTKISSKLSENENAITACTEAQPPKKTEKLMEKTEKQAEKIDMQNEKMMEVNLEEDITVNVEPNTHKTKKLKHKKKSKLHLQYDSETVEKSKKNINTALQEEATEIINEALQFNVPYMDKAADEVRKRINDQSLKQEHVHTLQRLINLENDHRKYVSSFCNYLQ